MKKYYLILLMLLPFLNFSQTQIGQDIDGEASGDGSGQSVSISSDGSIVAIGAPNNDGKGDQSGHVRVYKYESGLWTQLGQDINGEYSNNYSGKSVSLSSDGSIVAIGAPDNSGNGYKSGHVRVYKYESGLWTQLGQDIDGDYSNNYLGQSVSLSSDGSIVAIGAPEKNSGLVRIYKYVNGVWVQVGQDINGESSADDSGYSVSLSSDGSIVAIGAPYNDDYGYYSGQVRVYKYVSGVWTQVGQDINGDFANLLGYSVSLSSDGSIVAIGGVGDDANGVSYSGQVRVYKNVSGIWTQIGQDINGEAAQDYSGGTISLSSDGSIVVIGAWGNDGNGKDSGHVRIYKDMNGIWTQVGKDIDGKASIDYSGYSVSLSYDGSVVVIGSMGNTSRVYDLSAITLSTESFNYDYFTYSPNPVQDVLNINLNPGLNLKQVNIYSIESKYLYSVKDTKIDVSNLASGMYFFEVETNEGKSTKKIIIE